MKKTKVVALAAAAIIGASYADSASADTHTYSIKKGDTLSAIANKSGTTVAALKQLNSLKSDTIYPKQVLKLTKTTTNTSAQPKAKTPTANSSAKTYKVVSGDHLSKIAAKYNVTVANLMNWNNLKSTVIYPNQVLKISNSTVTTKPVTKPAPVNNVQPAKPNISGTNYIVKKGDTLGHISKAYGISVAQLKQMNNLKSDMIYIGQKLVLSGKASTNPAPVNNVQPAKPTTSGTSYIVKNGDTLGQISKVYGISVAQLKQLNNLKSDMIYVGQKLSISGKASTKPVTKPAAPVTENKDELIGTSAFTQKLIAESKKVLGTKYVFGGTTVKGFDCSGFIYYAFNKAGHSINRQSAAGYYDRSYYVNTPQPGDLVFFENTYKKGISHLGIYIGNNQFINADNSGVRIVSLDNSYYKKHFSSFKRFY